MVLNNKMDKVGGNTFHSNKNSQSVLNALIDECGLIDIFRANNPDKRVFSHFDKKNKTSTRIDFFLVDIDLTGNARSELSHGFVSDHSYVELVIEGVSIKRGRGYWKINNSYLEEEDYIKGVTEIINDTTGESFDSYSGLWEVIKFKVKDFSSRYGAKRKYNVNKEKEKIEKEIIDV